MSHKPLHAVPRVSRFGEINIIRRRPVSSGVRGLDVQVVDGLLMSVGQRAGDLGHELGDPVVRQAVAGRQVRQRAGLLDELERDVHRLGRQTLENFLACHPLMQCGHIDIDDAYDMGMIEVGLGFDFAQDEQLVVDAVEFVFEVA